MKEKCASLYDKVKIIGIGLKEIWVEPISRKSSRSLKAAIYLLVDCVRLLWHKKQS
jgi:hypothetical protein